MKGEQEYAALSSFRDGTLSPGLYARLAVEALFDPFRMVLRYMPGPLGFQLRRWCYGLTLGHLGRGALIDYGVHIKGPENLFLGEFTWIDVNCQLSAARGRIEIGSRCHIATGVVMNCHELLRIGDYTTLSHGVKVFGISETPGNGKRLSGPMIPEEHENLLKGHVIIGKDCYVGTNSVILPGVTLGEGAVIGANSLVKADVPAWAIAVGNPVRVVGTRDPVTVPDL